MQIAGCCQSEHERGRSKSIHHVVHIKSIAWTQLLAKASERAVEAVAIPVERDERRREQQEPLVPVRQRIRSSSEQLRGEAQRGEMVRRDPFRRSGRQPLQRFAFEWRGQSFLRSSRVAKFRDDGLTDIYGCGHLVLLKSV